MLGFHLLHNVSESWERTVVLVILLEIKKVGFFYLKALIFHFNACLTFLVFFRLSQLSFFLSPHIFGCFVFVCIFFLYILNPVRCSVFKSHHSLFVSLTQTFPFFPRDVYFWQRHPLSLESNAPESSPCFLPQFSLFSASRPSNDTFCHSKVVSISPPPFFFFKDYWLERLGAGEKICGLNSNSGFKSKDDLGLCCLWRAPGGSMQTLMKATFLFFFFLNKFVFSDKSALTCFFLIVCHLLMLSVWWRQQTNMRSGSCCCKRFGAGKPLEHSTQ